VLDGNTLGCCEAIVYGANQQQNRSVPADSVSRIWLCSSRSDDLCDTMDSNEHAAAAVKIRGIYPSLAKDKESKLGRLGPFAVAQ